MMTEIEAMSMNSNMHKIALKEKTLLKSYLEVDMNEYLQSQMDTSLFEGVDEANKAKFIGRYFNFIKCRFQDCNLVQTKSKLNMTKKSESVSPTAAESKAREDKTNVENWGKQGNLVPAHSKTHAAPSLAQTSEPSGPESKAREDKINELNWGKQGNLVPAHSGADAAPVLAQTGSSKDKMVTNSYHEVVANLQKEKDDLLVKPIQLADNKKDTEPMAVQTTADVKK